MSGTTDSSGHSEYESTFQRMHAEWLGLAQEVSPVTDWEFEFAAMVDEMRSLRESGHWRTGGRTLLRALDLHHDEVRLCKALAWLMTPDGWHGLGDLFLRRLLSRVGVDIRDTTTTSIVTEEVRGSTRADLVARVASSTVLIEAKVHAGEQPAQADRLAADWDDEAPTLVFLTHDGRTPQTAVDSHGQWSGLAWRDLAETLRAVVDEVGDCSPGVLDVLETIEIYGG